MDDGHVSVSRKYSYNWLRPWLVVQPLGNNAAKVGLQGAAALLLQVHWICYKVTTPHAVAGDAALQ